MSSSWIDLEKLAARESEQVEWKENVASIEAVVKTMTAFANDWSNLGGGYVVCGAREAKDEHGYQKMLLPGLTAARFKEVEGRILSACQNFVDPAFVPQVEELSAEDPSRRILIFVVSATGYAHTFRTSKDTGKYYIRIDRSTREARNGLLRELLVRKGQLEPWDRRCQSEATLGAIDLVAFRDALQRMNLWDSKRSLDDYFLSENGLSPFVPPLCKKEPLSGVLRPRNFTLLLFGLEIQRFFPGAYCVFSKYAGTDRSEPHAERLMLAGNILEQVRQLLKHLRAEAHDIIDKTGEKPNQVKYPRRALEETLVNAIVHRDYESDQPVRVTVFSDRIEMFSPGSLLPAVDPKRFLAGRPMPVWRNQALAWFFNKLHLAQAEGQGVATILRTMREVGCPPPLFEITTESVCCTVPAHPPPVALEIPALPEDGRDVQLSENEERLVANVFDVLRQNPIVLLLAQDGRADHAVLERVQERAGVQRRVLRVALPASLESDTNRYFASIARQCDFDAEIRSAIDWEDALGRRLRGGESLFLLITGFQNFGKGSEGGNLQLGSILRGFSEAYRSQLWIVLSGGEQLGALKYQSNSTSVLNSAERLDWPEPDAEDVLVWQRRESPEQSLSRAEAEDILGLCGGHPRLVRYCLDRRRRGEPVDLTGYDVVWQLFTGYRPDQEATRRICGWLEIDDLGQAEPWIGDALLRRLYWTNALVAQAGRLRWRGEIVRQVGRQVLRCE